MWDCKRISITNLVTLIDVKSNVQRENGDVEDKDVKCPLQIQM